VIDSSDGTKVHQSVSEEGVLTSTYAVEPSTEGQDSVDGEVSDAAPVPKGVQQDPSTGQTTVVLSSGEVVGHTMGVDGVLTMQSSAGTADATSDEVPIDDDETGQQAEGDEPSDAVLDSPETRLAVINPSVGEVITEGEVTVVESTFTESGGVAMVVASSEGESDAAPTEVAISADGTQQAITSSTGESATATTSDTGVVIAMDAGSMQDALDNLDSGDQQSMVAADGTSVVAAAGADGEVTFLDADGNPAVKEDGSSYTADDMAALVVAFGEG
jgi:hypothetical protein